MTDSIQASQRLIIIYSSHLLEAEWFELTLSLALELSVPLLFITTEDVLSSIPSRTVRAAYKVRITSKKGLGTVIETGDLWLLWADGSLLKLNEQICHNLNSYMIPRHAC